MAEHISRRGFLKGIAAGALVVGFDPIRRSWITAADAAEQGAAVDRANFPQCDGVIYFDEASLQEAADDFGHIIHRRPVAVLKPASVNDIVTMVRFANRFDIKVAGRGQAHSSYGQSQVEAGVVIDTSTLNTIHAITPTYADVDCGVKWRTLLEAALAEGLTPPVLTDYIELSIGGTLSCGGIGGASHQHGLLIDNALELLVVTGRGDLQWCSMDRQRKLFESVLAGLGQFGIIVRARVRLVPAESNARVFLLYYDDVNVFNADQITLINDERFHYVEGQVVAKDEGGWRFMLEAAYFYTPPAMPNNAALLAGLSYNPGSEQITDQTYFEFANRLEATIDFLKAIGVWGFPHPWFDVFMPSTTVGTYVDSVLANLTLDDTGQGPMLLYPVKRDRLTRPFFRVPDTDVVFLFDILRTAPPIPEVVNAMVAANRQLFEQARSNGGTRYPISAIPFDQSDWQLQFGEMWDEFVKAKKRYDPHNILTPGQNIF